jgi:hypothetical protein
MMKKFLKFSLRALAVLLLLGVVAFFVLDKQNPDGRPGDAAEQLAQKMADAVGKAAWDSTGWVKWTYAKRNSFVWDKGNGLVQVAWDDMRVLLRSADQSGQAWQKGVELQGEAAQKALKNAWSRFCNDSFWLNAPAKVFDAGTQRSLVALDNGKMGLKVQYGSGGVTPGDAYVWEMDDNGLPLRYEMWVKILPLGGISATWENWVTLPTGAKIATLHRIAGSLPVEVTGLDAGFGAASF